MHIIEWLEQVPFLCFLQACFQVTRSADHNLVGKTVLKGTREIRKVFFKTSVEGNVVTSNMR